VTRPAAAAAAAQWGPQSARQWPAGFRSRNFVLQVPLLTGTVTHGAESGSLAGVGLGGPGGPDGACHRRSHMHRRPLTFEQWAASESESAGRGESIVQVVTQVAQRASCRALSGLPGAVDHWQGACQIPLATCGPSSWPQAFKFQVQVVCWAWGQSEFARLLCLPM
jgi:hypothetical protein